jgi:predicted RNA-binding protein
MCLAKAYLTGGGRSELLLEEVARIEIEGTSVRLTTLFGETKEVQAVPRVVDFENSTVYVEAAS